MEERNQRKVTKKGWENRRKKNVFQVIRGLIIYFMIGVLGYMAYGIYLEASVRNDKKISEFMLSQGENKINTNQLEEKQSSFKPVIKTYQGYEVEARLEIPKIELNTNVLKEYTKKGLKVCASKYYGPNANEIGNYCIAGHNYKQKNMFYRLIQLKIGDSIFLTDNENGKKEYMIYDIYKVKPDNVEPLSQETQGEKEITLITCVNYSTRRLVVKAIKK